jgi:PAS domain S-box-containing protein
MGPEGDMEMTAGWPGLFWAAFRQSRNAMVLLDSERRHVEVNGAYLQLLGYDRSSLLGRPISDIRPPGAVASDEEWHSALRQRHFTGVADLLRADGTLVTVEFAGHPETVTGKQLVLFVVLSSGRQGRRFASGHGLALPAPPLSKRELQVIELIASGLEGPEIAGELGIAHNTVRTHVRNAMTKVGARSRSHLVAISLGEALFLGATPQ